jgi:hypothetical protein
MTCAAAFPAQAKGPTACAAGRVGLAAGRGRKRTAPLDQIISVMTQVTAPR